MTCQLKLYLCLNTVCACVLAFSSENRLNLAGKSNSIAELYRFSGFKGEKIKNLDIIPKRDEVKAEKPVHERFPHAVLFGSTCGGTIISPTWVLTAAHCTRNDFGNHIRAGTNNTQDGSGIFRMVERKIVHPRFSIGPYWLDAKLHNIKQVAARFDLLLAELHEPLPLDNITMAAAKLNENYNLAPKTLVAYAGYGTAEHGGIVSNQMHERKLELLSEDECGILEEYDSQDMICAKGFPPNYDAACGGDSGSGLVDENGVLLGVLSWGEGDNIECRKGSIVYFAKVAEVRDWIREVTNI